MKNLYDTIWLGLGTNLGNRAQHLHTALGHLDNQGVGIVRCSAAYETAPWGIEEQPAFLNLVCEVSFSGTAPELLRIVLDIELQMGRIREQKWGPRLIDIDLLEFQRVRWNTPELTLPHPYYTQRDFVVVPFAELAPDWIPTGDTRSLTDIQGQFAPLPVRWGKVWPKLNH